MHPNSFLATRSVLDAALLPRLACRPQAQGQGEGLQLWEVPSAFLRSLPSQCPPGPPLTPPLTQQHGSAGTTARLHSWHRQGQAGVQAAAAPQPDHPEDIETQTAPQEQGQTLLNY